MLKVTIVERPRSLNLVTLSRLKTSLGITDSDSDERLSDLIEDVSSAFVEYCGKHFARTLVTEYLTGYGDTTLSLARTPVVNVSEVRLRTSVIDASGYSIADKAAGFLRRENDDVWDDTQPRQQWITAERLNMQGEQAWQIDYMGGYLMPEDDFTASGTLSASSVDNSFNLSDEDDKFPLLVPGEYVQFSGFSNADNNGLFTIVSRTGSKLVVEETIVTEAPSGVVSITTLLPDNEDKLPRDLTRLAISEIRDRYQSEQRESMLTQEKIGDWSATYGHRSSSGDTENTFGFSQSTVRGLQRYIRVM